MSNKFRAWDGLRMTTSGIMFNTSTGEVEVPKDSRMVLMRGTPYKKDGIDLYAGDIVSLPSYPEGQTDIYIIVDYGDSFVIRDFKSEDDKYDNFDGDYFYQHNDQL